LKLDWAAGEVKVEEEEGEEEEGEGEEDLDMSSVVAAALLEEEKKRKEESILEKFMQYVGTFIISLFPFFFSSSFHVVSF
jgi:hypothetical protein